MEEILLKIKKYGGVIYEPRQKGYNWQYTFDLSALSEAKRKEVETLIYNHYNGNLGIVI